MFFEVYFGGLMDCCIELMQNKSFHNISYNLFEISQDKPVFVRKAILPVFGAY